MPTLKLSLETVVKVSEQMDQDIVFPDEEVAKEQDSGPTLRASSDSIPAPVEG